MKLTEISCSRLRMTGLAQAVFVCLAFHAMACSGVY